MHEVRKICIVGLQDTKSAATALPSILSSPISSTAAMSRTSSFRSRPSDARPSGDTARAERDRRITVVLGPTNTGKTHFAMERLTGYASGMIGFPLRLLARENYDRLVARLGAGSVT